MKFIDDQLNGITMYRLILYYLILLFGAAFYFSILGSVSLDPFALLFSLGLLIAVCWITNRVFSSTYGVPANVESVYISALILALIITPPQSASDIWFLIWVGILSMASKYIVAYKGKHLFNPAAFAVVLTYFTVNQSASWWIGSAVMLPVTLIGGLLVVRKIGRSDLVLGFLASNLAFTVLETWYTGDHLLMTLQNTFLYSPILFFACVILTEPLTTPPTRRNRIYYGSLLGFLFTPQLHFGALYITPELAIVLGNIFSFIVSPKEKLILKLKDKSLIAPDIYEFTFSAPRRFKFKPGQYMEWTLGHQYPDVRGNRRYFTLASSPSEKVLKLGIKFNENSSTFKKNMLSMNKGSEITASQLGGDFVLPNDRMQKYIFIAGGIGITPFRSMIKYLLDTRQHRSITLLYAVKDAKDIVYKDLLDRAERELGIKTIYSISNNGNHSSALTHIATRFDETFIRKTFPYLRTYIFYISGSRGMVEGFKSTLYRAGVSNSQIRDDFFPGLN